ncbi:DUF397 domain-containing protein [Streptomyces mirabilis]|uniref:DUF397 domain-containing protein n=1 Tax=Streptomyces mirabilis TaxID=68239 RepID=UPI003F4C5EA3
MPEHHSLSTRARGGAGVRAGGAWGRLGASDQSTASDGRSAGQECVEVARNIPGTVALRDSKDVDGPVVVVAPSAWAAFAVYVGQRTSRASH